jgi:hypothetical protein
MERATGPRASDRPGADDVARPDFSRFDYFGQYSLPSLLHQLAQALTNRIHLRTRFSRFIAEQYRLADRHLAADEVPEIYAGGFDVRSHCAGRDCLQPQRRRVLRNLFALDQSDLAAVRFSTGLLPPVKIAPILGNSFVGNNVDQLNRRQGRAWFHRMHVQGSDAAD